MDYYIFKKKVGKYLVKHRRIARTIKAMVVLVIFCYCKYIIKLDIDTIFLILSIWYLSEIRR